MLECSCKLRSVYISLWECLGYEYEFLVRGDGMKIKDIRAREVFNSRGWPTLACDIHLEDGSCWSSSVPAGLSRGRHEAHVPFDNDARLWGRGMRQAAEAVERDIAPLLLGRTVHAITMDLEIRDADGTQDKSLFGAPAMLATSMSLYRAHAHSEGVELYEFIGYAMGAESISLPFPLFNLINGGLHANNNLLIQEFLAMPVNFTDFTSAFDAGVVLFHELGNILKKEKIPYTFGEEGGYSPQLTNEKEALDILQEAIAYVQLQYGYSFFCALDVAASQLYDPASKQYQVRDAQMSSAEMVNFYVRLCEEYPICSIEDGLHEEDWEGWKLLTQMLKDRIQIVGDDIFVTNPHRIAYGIEHEIATASIIKPNQIGSVTEAIQAIQLCQEHGWMTIISHRSGETEDSFIADLAVGSNAGQIKAGGLTRGERLAKYNRLLTIEDHLKRPLSE